MLLFFLVKAPHTIICAHPTTPPPVEKPSGCFEPPAVQSVDNPLYILHTPPYI